jgi:release factor glutamine methyltransferase
MTVKDVLQNGFSILKKNTNNNIIDISTPYLDAVVLLSEALNVSREKLYMLFNDKVTDFGKEQYCEYIEKRLSGIPVSYIRTKKEFYGLDFYVDNRVLVPRPETESLVYQALEIIKYKITEKGRLFLNVIDVCTGSGCIAISLVNQINIYKKENKSLFDNIIVSACDISKSAIDVFKMNCKILLGQELPVFMSDLLSETENSYDIIISNPPYLTSDNVKRMLEFAWPEPSIALNGGENGLELVFRLIEQAKTKIRKDGYLLLEADDNQMQEIKEKMQKEGYADINIIKDLSGWNRVIYGSSS